MSEWKQVVYSPLIQEVELSKSTIDHVCKAWCLLRIHLIIIVFQLFTLFTRHPAVLFFFSLFVFQVIEKPN